MCERKDFLNSWYSISGRPSKISIDGVELGTIGVPDEVNSWDFFTELLQRVYDARFMIPILVSIDCYLKNGVIEYELWTDGSQIEAKAIVDMMRAWDEE